jgi:hypothetical protein
MPKSDPAQYPVTAHVLDQTRLSLGDILLTRVPFRLSDKTSVDPLGTKEGGRR